MCGRYTLMAEEEELARKFLLIYLSREVVENLQPRYNITPSQSIVAIRSSKPDGGREASLFSWGLVPFWAKDAKIGYKMINARSETAAEKPSFRAAMKSRRCIIPASGFYEWQRPENSTRKQPYYFAARNGEPFAMAGLWERWKSPEGTVLESCSILTTSANDIMAPIHDRMPVLLEERDFDLWLVPNESRSESIRPLFRPFPAGPMSRVPISTLVNSPKNNGPELIAEIDLKTGEFKSEPFGDLFKGL